VPGAEAERTRDFDAVLPTPEQRELADDELPTRALPRPDAPPPPRDGGRVTSPDAPTAPFLRPPDAGAGGVTGGGPADDAPTEVPEGGPPGAPLLTVPFGGVLPVPRGREGADRDATLAEGQALGGFALERRLAQRPTGELFAARHPLHGECAVWVLAPAMVSTYAGRGFLLDARARTTLEDARLVKVLAVGDAPRPWVAMERLRGATLRSVLDQQGPLPVAEAARIALELARALARVHARRIVHGDLTPRDVRLEGGAGAVKLTGFGVPKAIGPTGTRHAFSGGPALGDAGYAAPELFAGDRAEPPSDVWAVGCVLHEMLAGRPPFVGSALEVRRAVLEQDPPTLEAVRPDVPPALATVVRRCLSRRPADRYASGQALAEALLAAAPPAPDASPGRPRWRLLLGALLALAAALAAAAIAWRLLH
jgi:serine/threonine-protein kinase